MKMEDNKRIGLRVMTMMSNTRPVGWFQSGSSGL